MPDSRLLSPVSCLLSPGDAGEWIGNIDGNLACEPLPKAEAAADDDDDDEGGGVGGGGVGGGGVGGGGAGADVLPTDPDADPAAAAAAAAAALAAEHEQKDEL